MNVRQGLLCVTALLGLLLLLPPRVLAQPDTEEISVKNPLIDCSTNSAYNSKQIKPVITAVGGPGGQMQKCNACHQSESPRAGSGDKPVAKWGTALVQNRLSQPVTFSIKYGKQGEWKEYELKAG